ncbi:hypothetical protein NL676_022548 [Syzygium grande]|nr:hypothetical protein NL676_022548 [Syzygium grande]
MRGYSPADVIMTSTTRTKNPTEQPDPTTQPARSRGLRADEDDEEALRWAALQKLPTFKCLRRGILTASRGGGAKEIDIENLGFHERKRLLERLVRVAEEDSESFLLKLRNRIDRVGLDIPTIEVRFEHLNVEAEAHEGSRALPTVINFCTNFLEGFFNFLHIFPSRKKHLTIFQDVSGIIKPGRMTLLLGPPSSGKTTLFLALAGKLDPELKAAATAGQGANVVTDYILKILRMEICADTIVGDEMLRGISGGQRKRVTTEAFQSFHMGRKLGDELSTPFDESKNHPAALTTKRFGVGMKDLLKACISREFLLMKRLFKQYLLLVAVN